MLIRTNRKWLGLYRSKSRSSTPNRRRSDIPPTDTSRKNGIATAICTAAPLKDGYRRGKGKWTRAMDKYTYDGD
mgnify:CR=1 FL=1